MAGHFTSGLSDKGFFRYQFRKNLARLFFSVLLMAVLTVVVFALKLARGQPTYYATNSAGFVTELTAMSAPNMTDKELLPPDPVEEVQPKTLPDNF